VVRRQQLPAERKPRVQAPLPQESLDQASGKHWDSGPLVVQQRLDIHQELRALCPGAHGSNAHPKATVDVGSRARPNSLRRPTSWFAVARVLDTRMSRKQV